MLMWLCIISIWKKWGEPMRKVLCVLLVISLMLSLVVPVFAEDGDEPAYGRLWVEYSDVPGKIEQLDVMVSDGYIYADADVLSERLGFRFSRTGDVISIYTTARLSADAAPMLAVHFRLGDTQVSYNPLFGLEHEYTAPCPAVENDQGVWVPLRYTLDLLGGGSNQLGDVLWIQMPDENVLSVAAMIAAYSDHLAFDWGNDFGYSEGWSMAADGAARVVTLFDGLLDFDAASWTVFANWYAFDQKFGGMLTTMFCTKSNEEFEQEIEKVERLLDIFSPDSTLGKLLKQMQVSLDADVGAWNTACENCLKMVEAGTASDTMYNVLYNQLETALDRQGLFTSLGGDVLVYVQDGMSDVTNYLDMAAWVGKITTYYQEFQNADDFTTSVLWDYLTTHSGTDEMSVGMDVAMLGHTAGLQTDGTLYSVMRFVEDNLFELLMEEANLDTALGLPANILLMAWDIASDSLDCYAGGLKAVEKREISNYAQKLQNDAMINVQELMTGMKSGEIPLDSQSCMKLAKYSYVFLKACYIARSAAVESLDLENKDEDFLNNVKGRIDTAYDTNTLIAEYLCVLSQADERNKNMTLGFLPENNEKYLENPSDEDLLNMITQPVKQLTRVDVYNESGSLIRYDEYFYNDFGLLEGVVMCLLRNGESHYQKEISRIYDAQNRLIYETIGNPQYSTTECSVEYTYDNRDRRSTVESEGDVCCVEKYEYDVDDKIVRTTEIFDGGYSTIITNHTYDDNGQLIKDVKTWNDGACVETTLYDYDSEGRILCAVTESVYWTEFFTDITRYDYSYLPFAMVHTQSSISGVHCDVIAKRTDVESLVLGSDGFNDPRFYTDADGYLAKVIDRDFNGDESVYEFSYDGKIAEPINGPFYIESE